MSKYNVDLDYVICDVDITSEELREIKAEADKIISNYEESEENRAIACLKKVQCLRKLGTGQTGGFIYYEDPAFFSPDDAGIIIKTEDLKELLKSALRLSPNMPEVFMQLGLLNIGFLFINDQEETINLFTKAIQLKPDYAAAFNNRAMIFNAQVIFDDMENKDNSEKNKNYRSAVADLTEAIRIRPFDAVYHLNRGIFHSKLGEHKEAVEDFSKAIDYASDKLKEKLVENVLIYKLRGKEYLEMNECIKAIDDFSESLRSVSGDDGTLIDNDTLLLRAKAYYLAGEKDKTKKVFDEYLNRKRNDAVTEGSKKIYELTGLKPEDIL